MPAAPRKWKSEAELCAALAAAATRAGMVSYPEVDGWDLVLVATDGTQIGIQAKLRATWAVLEQATRPTATGPQIRAVLVPIAPWRFRSLAGRLALRVFTGDDTQSLQQLRLEPRFWYDSRTRVRYAVPVIGEEEERLLHLPCVVPTSVVAGSPSPRTLSSWRESVLLVCALLRRDGSITGSEVKAAGLRASALARRGWLDRIGMTASQPSYGIYAPGPSPLPDVGWEAERDAIWQVRGHEMEAAIARRLGGTAVKSSPSPVGNSQTMFTKPKESR